MPAEQGPAERFAAAIEQGRSPRSVADAELARDLEIVAMLRSPGEVYSPRPDDKARAKQRLMAMLAQPDEVTTAPLGRIASPAPYADDERTTVMPAVTASTATAALAADSLDDPGDSDARDLDETAVAPVGRAGRRAGRHTMPGRMSGRAPSRPAGRARSAGRGLRKRVLVVGTAALVALVAVAGGGIFASRNALPGDSLYAVKRVAESAGLAMTFDRSAKAHRQLELATTRLDEVEQMVAKAPAAAKADPELVRSAIQDFDSNTGDGSRSLMDTDDAGGSATLGDLRAWASDQAARLSTLRSTLPSDAVPGADSTISFLDRLLGRTEALSSRSSCSQVTSGTVDDLGPLPAEGPCSPRPSKPDTTSGNGESQNGTSGTGTSTTDPSKQGPSGVSGAPSTIPKANDPDALVPGPDGTAVPDTTSGSPSSTSSKAPKDGSNLPVPVPLPLLPPINLPPLLPGLPGMTIG